MSNIRQLNEVFSVYISDNSKFPYGFDDIPLNPPPEGRVGNQSYDRNGWWWFNYLGKLYKKGKDLKTIIQCPSRQIVQRGLVNDILCGNYGINLSICRMSRGLIDQNEFVGIPRLDSEVLRPSQTLLIVDSGYAIINWKHAADFPTGSLGSNNIERAAYIPGLSINRQKTLIPGQEIDAFYGRHPQISVNAGFVDGHTARMNAEELLVKQTPDGSYSNKYPLWTLDSK